MGNVKSARTAIEPVQYTQNLNEFTQVFLLQNGCVLICRNGNQFVQYSAKHSVTRRIRKKYHLDQK